MYVAWEEVSALDTRAQLSPQGACKECLLAEEWDNHSFPLLILKNHLVSGPLCSTLFLSPGWWHSAIDLQRYVNVQQHRASHKEFLWHFGGFWLFWIPSLYQNPCTHRPSVLSRKTRPRASPASSHRSSLGRRSFRAQAGSSPFHCLTGSTWREAVFPSASTAM